MQHQPHEGFFSFTVPPKPANLNPSPSLSTAIQSFDNQHSHLLSSIVTDFDSPHQSSPHLNLSSRSPSSISPSGTSLNRPNTACPFAFNVPSVTPSTASRLSPNHPSTSSSSIDTVVNRPFSSSGSSNIHTTLPRPLSSSQTPSSNRATSNDAHRPPARPNYAHITSSDSQPCQPSPLLAPAAMSNQVIAPHSTRPMTAPGPSWAGGNHLNDSFEFSSSHIGLFGQSSSWPPQQDGLVLLSKTLSNEANSCTNNGVDSSPGPSSIIISPVDPISQAPVGSSSGSSNPEPRLQGSNFLDTPDCPDLPTSPLRTISGPGRPSLGARSSDSAPESPDSSDVDHIHPPGFLHSISSQHSHQVLRPSTHSGTSASFGHGDRLIPHALHSRPTTGYSHLYDLSAGCAPIHSVGQHYSHRPSLYTGHGSQIYAGAGHYSHGLGSIESSGHDRLYNFNILPGAPRKRARRRFDEVERLYDCNYPGCTKAYGTLNHLNAHITMQKHGSKRLPQEFKEIRKEWRARKKAEAEARAVAMKQSVSSTATSHEYNILGGPDSFRPPASGVSNNSSPSSSSAGGGFAYHIRSSALGGPYSAPPHSHQFPTSDLHSDWYSEHRTNPTTIDEQPEYVGSVPCLHPDVSLLPPQVSGSPSGRGAVPIGEQAVYSPSGIAGSQPNQNNRGNPSILSCTSPLIDQS